jgi:predicted ATPase
MLSGLDLTNFRAFKSEKFIFSRLNIFAGPNNSGKSSVISAINLLAQSLPVTNHYERSITLNGAYDQLGTFKDMVHGGRASTPIRIGVSVDDYTYDFDIKYRLQRREMEISKFKLLRGTKSVYEYISAADRYDILVNGKKFEAVFPTLRKAKPRMISFLPRLPESLMEFRYRTARDVELAEQYYELVRGIETNLSRFTHRINRVFANYDSLGAFREMPQRTYLWSGETAEKIGRFGQNSVTLLASDSLKRGSEQVGYVDEVSNWLKTTGIAQGIKVKHLTDRHFELVVVGNDKSDHNIADVGFGCSQVLPVLIAGLKAARLSKTRTGAAPSSPATLVVQEPEIHLHPNAQAELGTFFSGLVKLGPQMFVETHSDNLVLRVARHVASGDISPDDVRIFYIKDVEGVKQVTPIQISRNGTFLPEWPDGFFPQRQRESFSLAKAAMTAPQGNGH